MAGTLALFKWVELAHHKTQWRCVHPPPPPPPCTLTSTSASTSTSPIPHLHLHLHLHLTWQGWHFTAVSLRLLNMLRATTANVLGQSLPRLVVMEGLNAPNKLNFNVSQQWLDTAMYAKALKLVKEHEKFILRGDTQAHGATTAGYVLSMGQMDDHPNITYGLVKKCVPPMPTCLLCPRASCACLLCPHASYAHVPPMHAHTSSIQLLHLAAAFGTLLLYGRHHDHPC